MKGAVSLTWIVFLALVCGMNAVNAQTAFPTQWWVNGNGYTGLLIYKVNPGTQRVSGTLLGTPVEGYLIGRHLILHRFPKGNTQIWEGWIMDKSLGADIPSYNWDYIVAGSISIEGDRVTPWFGVESGKTAGVPQPASGPGTAGGTGIPSTTTLPPLSGQAQVVAGSLHGLRWEMPGIQSGASCKAADPRPVKTTQLGGDPNRIYSVTLRFRGVVEEQSYAGGTQKGRWYVGGRSADGIYNIYKLEIMDPHQVFFLNAGRAGLRRCWMIDYTQTILIRGGAKITLSADAQDGWLVGNVDDKGKPIVVPGVPPAPLAYKGQFIQMDVVSVVAK
jgi:hypothetical protein